MSIDVIGNFLTVIRNGTTASKPFVVVPFSRMNFDIAKILLNEGFIKDCAEITKEHNKKELKITLKYVDGESTIHEISRKSTPGRRYYSGFSSIKPVIGGLGISILSTNRGILTNKQAQELGVGGEVICTVW